MIIINRKNNLLTNCIFICFLLFCINCKSQKKISDRNCTLSMSNEEMLLEVNNNEILKNQLKEFYNDNNKYDIIFHKSKPGEINVTFKRIYKNKDSKWIYIEISNNKIIIQKEIGISNSDFDVLFNNFKNIGMYKNCGMCFGCYSYFNLIKKDNETFSYYYDSLSGNLTNNDLAKIAPYLKTLNFFNEYGISFTE